MLRIPGFALVGLLAFGLQAHAAPAPKVFTLRIPGEPETLDWNRAHTMVETYILMNLMEGLVTFDKDLRVVPALAESWTKSADGRTYTFKLRKGVKWSDGVPLKAADFVYSWKRLISPVTAASYAYFLFDIEGAELYYKNKLTDFSAVGIKALDDQTFQVKLARPVQHWMYIPTFWVTFPMRQDVVEQHGQGWHKPGRMVTLGAFTLAAHDIDSKIVLKANPLYWGSRGNIDQVEALIVKDDSTALSLYESGKFDFLTDISTLDLKRLEGRPDLKAFPYLKTGYLGFAQNKYPLSNVKVRRAIAMAIDKTQLPKILHGGQVPATSYVPPRMMAHSKDIGFKFDPIKAKAELREAGFDTSKPLTIELLCPNWDKQLTLAQFIQAELKRNLGVNVQIQAFDHKTFRANMDLNAYPLFEASWSADFPDPDNFLSMYMSDSGNNRTTWKNAKFDERVLEARNINDQKVRERAYLEVQKMLLEEHAVIVPLYYEPNMALVKPRVSGLELNPVNYLLLRKVTLGP
jgi:oligopeptide transport system substrate-binding protein